MISGECNGLAAHKAFPKLETTFSGSIPSFCQMQLEFNKKVSCKHKVDIFIEF